MEYRFECRVIEKETDEIISSSTTFIIPESISESGACENVDEIVGQVMRRFRLEIKRLEAKNESRYAAEDDAEESEEIESNLK